MLEEQTFYVLPSGMICSGCGQLAYAQLVSSKFVTIACQNPKCVGYKVTYEVEVQHIKAKRCPTSAEL